MSKKYKKRLLNFELYWALTYFSFCGCRKCFNFCFGFFSWHFYRHCEVCVRIKNFPYNCGIKKYKPIITKLRKEHDKIVLLAKTKLNITGILISKDLLDSYISHDEFFPATNALKKYDDLKEAIKNPKAISKYV